MLLREVSEGFIMNAQDIIAIGFTLAALFYVGRRVWRMNKSKGKCCGCSSTVCEVGTQKEKPPSIIPPGQRS